MKESAILHEIHKPRINAHDPKSSEFFSWSSHFEGNQKNIYFLNSMKLSSWSASLKLSSLPLTKIRFLPTSSALIESGVST